jgi:DNA-binding XRE family transcriptional regulator
MPPKTTNEKRTPTVRHEELRQIAAGMPDGLGAQTMRVYLSYSKADLAKLLELRRADVEGWELGEIPVPEYAWNKLGRMITEALRDA